MKNFKAIIYIVTIIVLIAMAIPIILNFPNKTINENKALVEEEKNENDYSIKPNEWKKEKVKIIVKDESITKTSADIIIEDKNDMPVSWGVNFALQISAGEEKWENLIEKEKIAWIEIAMVPNSDGITEMHIDWHNMYGELKNGTYRVLKYNGMTTLYSEPFSIK